MQCLQTLLTSMWIMVIGDSTQRQFFLALLRLLTKTLNFDCLVALPFVGGFAIIDRDGHKDYDAFCRPCVVQNKNQRAFLTCGSLYVLAPREAWGRVEWPDAKVLPKERENEWRDTINSHQSTVISLRFLRGLDLHKLAELNARDWRQSFFYVDWFRRGANRARAAASSHGGYPSHLVYAGDDFRKHPIRRAHLKKRADPNVIILNTGAWAIPLINRSAVYYPGQGPSNPCPVRRAPAFNCVDHRKFACASDSVKVANSQMQQAPAFDPPCLKRGVNLTDQEIIDGFEIQLASAVSAIRRSKTVQLILRNCHTGTRDARQLAQPIRNALVRVNKAIDRVATGTCTSVLDVWSIDLLLNYSAKRRDEDFHVTMQGSVHAALSAILMLRRLKTEHVST